jgi:prepilin peptidase CpaA
MIATMFGLAFCAVVLFAAWRDVAEMLIPNWCSIALAVLFVPAAAAAGLTLEQFGWHIAFGSLVLAACAALFFLGVFGGGDAKMLAACSLWTGMSGSLEFVLWTALAGGLLSGALILLRRARIPATKAWARRLLSPEEGAPYVVAIAAGAIMAAPASPILAAAVN